MPNRSVQKMFLVLLFPHPLVLLKFVAFLIMRSPASIILKHYRAQWSVRRLKGLDHRLTIRTTHVGVEIGATRGGYCSLCFAMFFVLFLNLCAVKSFNFLIKRQGWNQIERMQYIFVSETLCCATVYCIKRIPISAMVFEDNVHSTYCMWLIVRLGPLHCCWTVS